MTEKSAATARETAVRRAGEDRAEKDRTPWLDRVLVGVGWAYFVVSLALAGVAVCVLWVVIVSAGAAPAPPEGSSRIEEAIRSASGDMSPTLFLAVVAAAVSVPLVFYRARLQQRAVRAAEESERNAKAQLALSEKAERRRELTDLRLRGTEMLGATKTEQIAEPTEIWEEAGDGKRLKKQVMVTRSVAKPNMEVRVAGIGILEEVAQAADPFSAKLENHWPVMETLLAYIRTVRAPLDLWDGFAAAHPEFEGRVGARGDLLGPEMQDGSRAAASSEEQIAFAQAKAQWAKARIAEAPPPGEDVGAIATVLRRRDAAQQALEVGRAEPIPAPDWPAFDAQYGSKSSEERVARAAAIGAFLSAWRGDSEPADRHFDLKSTPLHRAQLEDAPLRLLNLSEARLEGADLRKARLEGADLSLARLEGAHLSGARLEGAGLGGARLEGADLRLARLEGAILRGARLEGADLGLARLEGADLGRAHLAAADFWGATLLGTTLHRADAARAGFEKAQLDGADFYEARLEGASLNWIGLRGASLAHATLVPNDARNGSADGMDDERNALADAAASGIWSEIFADQSVADQIRRLGLEPPDHWLQRYNGQENVDRAWAAWRKERDMPLLPQHAQYQS